MSAAKSITPEIKPVSDYSQLELLHPIMNCSNRERKSQVVSNIRAQDGVYFKETPVGIEIFGGPWRGVVPWANIKRAMR